MTSTKIEAGEYTDSDDLLNHETWVAALKDGTLLGQRCEECNRVTAAPKAACTRCGTRHLETVVLPTEGKVYSKTRIEVAPEGFDAPYQIGLIHLGETSVMARVMGSVSIGDGVEFTGVIETDPPAPEFKPKNDSSNQ